MQDFTRNATVAVCLFILVVITLTVSIGLLSIFPHTEQPYRLEALTTGRVYSFHCPPQWTAEPVAWVEGGRYIVRLGGDTFFYDLPAVAPAYVETECGDVD